jgi:hypothetical protein
MSYFVLAEVVLGDEDVVEEEIEEATKPKPTEEEKREKRRRRKRKKDHRIPSQCSVCNKTLSSQKLLKAHMQVGNVFTKGPSPLAFFARVFKRVMFF